MFLLVSGAAASGKSTYARLLSERLAGVACHDADEMVARTSDARCAVRAGRSSSSTPQT